MVDCTAFFFDSKKEGKKTIRRKGPIGFLVFCSSGRPAIHTNASAHIQAYTFDSPLSEKQNNTRVRDRAKGVKGNHKMVISCHRCRLQWSVTLSLLFVIALCVSQSLHAVTTNVDLNEAPVSPMPRRYALTLEGGHNGLNTLRAAPAAAAPSAGVNTPPWSYGVARHIGGRSLQRQRGPLALRSTPSGAHTVARSSTASLVVPPGSGGGSTSERHVQCARVKPRRLRPVDVFVPSDTSSGEAATKAPSVIPSTEEAEGVLKYAITPTQWNPNRPGERDVGMEDFFQCMSDRLQVDHVAQTMDSLPPTSTIPLVVIPLIAEVGDVRALICSLTVSIRYVVFVRNENFTHAADFLSDINAVFAWTERVKVYHLPENVGLPGSVNVGMKEALTHPFEEVPYIHVMLPNVRFAPFSLERRAQIMRHLVRRDYVREDALECEVTAEPSPYTPKFYPEGVLRRGDYATANSLSTSQLLPDRIRWETDVQARSKEFHAHTGMMFFTDTPDPSSFFVSRLAIRVVGFFDENFFPGPFADVDYVWRLQALGFKVYHNLRLAGTSDGAERSTLRRGRALAASQDTREEREGQPSPHHCMQRLPSALSLLGRASVKDMAGNRPLLRLLNGLKSVSKEGFSLHYAVQKWNTQDPLAPASARYSAPFGVASRIPLDVWARDDERIGQIRRALHDTRKMSAVRWQVTLTIYNPYIEEEIE